MKKLQQYKKMEVAMKDEIGAEKDKVRRLEEKV